MDMQAKYARWEQQERKMKIVGRIAFVIGVAAIMLVVVDAVQKWAA